MSSKHEGGESSGAQFFLKAGEAASVARVNTSSLRHHASRQLHRLHLPASTYLYPAEYIREFAAWKETSTNKIGHARDFARTDTAQELIAVGEDQFEDALQEAMSTLEDGRTAITPRNIERLLNVGRATVTAWVRRDGLLTPMESSFSEYAGQQCFPERDFRQIYSWELPDVLVSADQ